MNTLPASYDVLFKISSSQIPLGFKGLVQSNLIFSWKVNVRRHDKSKPKASKNYLKLTFLSLKSNTLSIP